MSSSIIAPAFFFGGILCMSISPALGWFVWGGGILYWLAQCGSEMSCKARELSGENKATVGGVAFDDDESANDVSFSCLPITTRIAGVSFNNDDGGVRQIFLEDVSVGEELYLRREPGNKYDCNAVAVVSENGVIGYLPKEVAGGKFLSEWLDLDALRASVSSIGRGGNGLLGLVVKIKMKNDVHDIQGKLDEPGEGSGLDRVVEKTDSISLDEAISSLGGVLTFFVDKKAIDYLPEKERFSIFWKGYNKPEDIDEYCCLLGQCACSKRPRLLFDSRYGDVVKLHIGDLGAFVIPFEISRYMTYLMGEGFELVVDGFNIDPDGGHMKVSFEIRCCTKRFFYDGKDPSIEHEFGFILNPEFFRVKETDELWCGTYDNSVAVMDKVLNVKLFGVNKRVFSIISSDGVRVESFDSSGFDYDGFVNCRSDENNSMARSAFVALYNQSLDGVASGYKDLIFGNYKDAFTTTGCPILLDVIPSSLIDYEKDNHSYLLYLYARHVDDIRSKLTDGCVTLEGHDSYSSFVKKAKVDGACSRSW